MLIIRITFSPINRSTQHERWHGKWKERSATHIHEEATFHDVGRCSVQEPAIGYLSRGDENWNRMIYRRREEMHSGDSLCSLRINDQETST